MTNRLARDWEIELAIPFIQSWEGCRLEAYRCSAGEETIGWGHTKGVKMGDKITLETAKKFLNEDLTVFRQDLDEMLKVSITKNQFIALMSFIFNIGEEQTRQSTLIRKLNNGDVVGAQEQFERWVYAGGKVVQGLVNRRKAEAELFGK